MYRIIKLDTNHNKELFSCGIKDLDDYLKLYSEQNQRNHITITYVILEEKVNSVIGYYTLSATSINLIGLPNDILKKLPKYPLIPAILVGRLAVDKKYHKHGLGEMLLVDALRRAKKISDDIALFSVVVDAKTDDVIAFYKKYNFIQFTNNIKKLFLPIREIEKLLLNN